MRDWRYGFPVGMVFLAASFLLPGLTGHAEVIRDDKSGMVVSTPADYAAKVIEEKGRSHIEMTRVKDEKAWCSVRFAQKPANNAMTTEAINERAKAELPYWAVASYSDFYTVEKIMPVSLQGAEGIEFIGVPRKEMAPDSANAYYAVFETRKGSALFLCSTKDKNLFEQALPDFKRIVQLVTLPK